MPKKFGVSLDDKIAEEVTRSLEYGDFRSERIEELADVWINVIERGYANCHLVTVHDFEKTVENLPWHSLS
jgi:hypothetical protein